MPVRRAPYPGEHNLRLHIPLMHAGVGNLNAGLSKLGSHVNGSARRARLYLLRDVPPVVSARRSVRELRSAPKATRHRGYQLGVAADGHPTAAASGSTFREAPHRASVDTEFDTVVCGWCCKPPRSGRLTLRTVLTGALVSSISAWDGLRIEACSPAFALASFARTCYLRFCMVLNS